MKLKCVRRGPSMLIAAVCSMAALSVFIHQKPRTFLGAVSTDSSVLSKATVSSNNSSDSYIVPIPEYAPYGRSMNSVFTNPWKEDVACSQYDVRLGINLPQIFLVSYPRSGNSWCRYLAEGATGFFTGSVYTDGRLRALGFLGEMVPYQENKTLLTKDHMFNQTKHVPVEIVDQSPVVLIIRNPFDNFLYLFSFRRSRSYENNSFFYKSDPELFKSPEFHRNIARDLRSWEEKMNNRLVKNKYLHVIIYEELKADPVKEMKKLLKFLRIPEDEGRLKCLAKHAEGPVNRGQPNFQPYTESESKLMKEAIQRVSSHLVARGYPPLPY